MRETILRTGQGERHFRWRGKDVSRVENFSDIVFALALTLIVASQVPETFDQLVMLWREFIAVLACFLLLFLIWRAHYIYFRRYDLEDGRTIFLNILLLFLVMVFAYPLKFLALTLVELSDLFVTLVLDPGAADSARLSQRLPLEKAPMMTVIYSVGYAALFAIFGLMYTHARRMAHEIGLNEVETLLTRASIHETRIHACVGLLAALCALALPLPWSAYAGFVYFFIWPLMAIHGMRLDRRLRDMEAE